MKHGKIIEGNVIIAKGCKDDFSEVEQITGSLYINSDAKLDALQSVGGGLDINSSAKLDAPNLQSVGGYLYIDSDAKLDAPNLQSVGGYLNIHSDAKLDALQSVGGYLYIYSSAKLDAPNLQSVGGYLYIYSSAKLDAPNLQSVGGGLYINSSAKLDAPNLQSVGGYLYINSSAKLDALQSVGGSLYINSSAKLDAPNLQSVGGSLYIHSDAKLDALQSVGGSLYIHSDAKLDAPNAKFNVAGTAKAAIDFNFQCFLKMGYLFADRMLAKIISRKKIGNTCIYKIQLAGQTKNSYCVEVDGVFSHGDTVAEAKESLKFKISDRDTSMYGDFNLDTEVTLAEGIQMYRKITGACERGTRHFVNHILREKKEKYKIKEIIELTKGQYNCEKLQEF